MNKVIENISKKIKNFSYSLNIIVESPGIGVGKTTLCKWLTTILPASLAEEDVDDRVLESLYTELANGTKNSKKLFLAEVYFFFSRIIQSVLFDFDKSLINIYDRGLSSSLAFSSNLHSKGVISWKDFKYLLNLFYKLDRLNFFIPSNTVVFYLKVAPEIQLCRIKERGRPSETGITIEYLNSIEKAYKGYVWDYYKEKGVKVITIDWTTFDRKKFLSELGGFLDGLAGN